MPIICRYSGMVFVMNYEAGGKHKAPHVHVRYQGKEVSIDLDGKRVEGEIPTKKIKEIRELLERKQLEFQENWRRVCQYEPLFEIDTAEEDSHED